jgi:hypothetical protein
MPISPNCETRNDPDLVQAFLKKWWVESDFKAPNQRNIFKFKNLRNKQLYNGNI